MRHGLTNSGSCFDTNQAHEGSVITGMIRHYCIQSVGLMGEEENTHT